MNETKFYIDYLKNNPHPELQIIALAFEYAPTEARAWSSIEKMRNALEIPYPILLAQSGSSNKVKANEKLPMLNHVLYYPTTIFVDKKGAVRKIHTGFNGPATGEKHLTFKRNFETFVAELLKETP